MPPLLATDQIIIISYKTEIVFYQQYCIYILWIKNLVSYGNLSQFKKLKS